MEYRLNTYRLPTKVRVPQLENHRYKSKSTQFVKFEPLSAAAQRMKCPKNDSGCKKTEKNGKENFPDIEFTRMTCLHLRGTPLLDLERGVKSGKSLH